MGGNLVDYVSCWPMREGGGGLVDYVFCWPMREGGGSCGLCVLLAYAGGGRGVLVDYVFCWPMGEGGGGGGGGGGSCGICILLLSSFFLHFCSDVSFTYIPLGIIHTSDI